MKTFLTKIILWVNYGFAFALLLAYLSNYISPAYIWPLAFFGLGYPLLLLVNIFFILFWSWRGKKYILVSLIFVLIGFSYAGRYYQFGNKNTPPQTNEPQLNVLSYNVRLFNRFRWQGDKSTLDSIFNFFAKNEFNLICLQEFYNHPEKQEEMKRYMRSKLPNVKNAEISYYFRNSNKNRVGLAILSEHPIVRSGNITFNESNNAAIYSDLIYEGDTVRVYNIHLQSVSLEENDYRIIDSLKHLSPQGLDEMKGIPIGLRNAYRKRASQAKDVSSHVKKSPYPVILCGDFNDTPLSYTYQKILGSMKDAYKESGRGTGQTYQGKLPSYRIDYIFYSDFFTSSNFETNSLSLSDHYPISTKLKIAK